MGWHGLHGFTPALPRSVHRHSQFALALEPLEPLEQALDLHLLYPPCLVTPCLACLGLFLRSESSRFLSLSLILCVLVVAGVVVDFDCRTLCEHPRSLPNQH